MEVEADLELALHLLFIAPTLIMELSLMSN
jgi:hypothetical protein